MEIEIAETICCGDDTLEKKNHGDENNAPEAQRH